MSYILDALRKSEHERQASSARGAGLLLPPAFAEPPPRRWLGASVVAVLATGAAALAWTLWPGPAVTPRPSAAVVAPSPAAAPVVTTAPTPPATSTAAAAATAPAAPRSIDPAGAPTPTRNKPARKALASPAASMTPPLASAPPKPVAAAAAPPAASTVDDDAPKGLPTLTVSGFIDDEQGRLAIINDKLVREGDEVAPGVRLEAIEGDRAHFSYKGRRFRR